MYGSAEKTSTTLLSPAEQTLFFSGFSRKNKRDASVKHQTRATGKGACVALHACLPRPCLRSPEKREEITPVLQANFGTNLNGNLRDQLIRKLINFDFKRKLLR